MVLTAPWAVYLVCAGHDESAIAKRCNRLPALSLRYMQLGLQLVAKTILLRADNTPPKVLSKPYFNRVTHERKKRKEKLWSIANFPKTFGAILLKLAGWIEVIEDFKIPPQLCSAPMPFEGATTQILAKKRRGRPG